MDKYEKYIEAQAAWIKMVDLKEGDSVKVLSAATSGQHGWDNVWNPQMDCQVGKTLTVYRGSGGRGIILSDSLEDTTYEYPFFILQKIEAPMPEPIKISHSYEAEFKKGGDIKVGCQEISYDLLKQIYETATKVKNK